MRKKMAGHFPTGLLTLSTAKSKKLRRLSKSKKRIRISRYRELDQHSEILAVVDIEANINKYWLLAA